MSFILTENNPLVAKLLTFKHSNVKQSHDYIFSEPDQYINVKYVTNQFNDYTILNYDKQLLNIHKSFNVGLCRSVIINSKCKVVGFAPPKSINIDAFMFATQKHDVTAEEFVDGVMINLFYDHSFVDLTLSEPNDSGAWQISTKTTVGGNVKFYQDNNKTFNEMFCEAVNHANLDISTLDNAYSYSFVLKHPECRIVAPVQNIELYLVAVYKIVNNATNITIHSIDTNVVKPLFETSNVKYPETYAFETINELIHKYASVTSPFNVVGFVIKDDKGNRCKYRNPVYERIKQIKGNFTKSQYLYLALNTHNHFDEYLWYFPEHIALFNEYSDKITTFIDLLYHCYVEKYIVKRNVSCDPMYYFHMKCLHNIYIERINSAKQDDYYGKKRVQGISKQDVATYVKNLDHHQLYNVIR